VKLNVSTVLGGLTASFLSGIDFFNGAADECVGFCARATEWRSIRESMGTTEAG